MMLLHSDRLVSLPMFIAAEKLCEITNSFFFSLSLPLSLSIFPWFQHLKPHLIFHCFTFTNHEYPNQMHRTLSELRIKFYSLLITSTRLLRSNKRTYDPGYVLKLYAQICWNLEMCFFIPPCHKFPNKRDVPCTKKTFRDSWERESSPREERRLENSLSPLIFSALKRFSANKTWGWTRWTWTHMFVYVIIFYIP